MNIIKNTLLMIGLIFGQIYANSSHMSSAMHHHLHDHDNNAPISIMGDHMHQKGEWMLSFRTMQMEMEDNVDGSMNLSTSDVFSRGYMVTPTKMTMKMHMLGIMYAPSDKWTMMLMLPYQDLSMEHLMKSGRRFNANVDGLGDIKWTSLISLVENPMSHWHLNLGMSFPTGSVDERGNDINASAKLPYPMQLGSGTWDMMPGVTYQRFWKKSSFGLQTQFTLRTGENDQDYRLGNEFQTTCWYVQNWNASCSSSLKLKWKDWSDIQGADPELNPAMISTADPDKRSGTRLDLGIGFDWHPKHGWLKGHRLALEFSMPMYQHLNGPQLEVQHSSMMGWKYVW